MALRVGTSRARRHAMALSARSVRPCSSLRLGVAGNQAKAGSARRSVLRASTPALATLRQLSATPAPVHETPQYMDFDTLVDMHLVTRQSFGDRPLFGTKRGGQWQWLTYKDFGKKVDRCRAALASLGVRRGDTVASISNNREEWAVCAYATYSLGAAYVPMYEEQRLKDWRYILEDAGAKVLFVSKESIHNQTYHFAGVLGALQHVFCFEAPASEPHSFEGLMARSESTVPPFLPHPDELATLIYTSGTTGQPKGVMLSHRNLISNITGLRAIIPEDLISCHDRSLSFLPWAHCYGQTAELHAFMAHGAALGIAEGVDKLLGNLGEVKPTVLFAVPTVFKKAYDAIHSKVHEGSPLVRWLFARSLQAAHHRRMHEERGQPVSRFLAMEQALLDRLVLSKIRDRFGGRLKVSFVGGAATPLEVLNFFENIGIKICEGYGLTETSPLITVNSPEAKFRRLGSTGRCLTDVVVKIVSVSESGAPHEVPAGTDGEVCVSGPNVMMGYRNLPEATREVFFEMDGRRFFRTGDLGRMDEGTYLRITGRIKEQYKLENGKYVVPGPIEAKMATSRYIQRALLFGQDRPFNVALLEPDWALLRQWAATKTDLPADATKGQLEAHPAVQNLIEGELQVAMEGIKKYEVPRKWALLHDSLQERGMLTPKLSVKRHVVASENSDLIRHLYGEARQEHAMAQEEPLPRAVAA